MSPWAGTMSDPEERWHKWWAWYPVTAPAEPGHVSITFFEWVWRRRVNGKWEYQLFD